ncbi:hypothetical protein ACFL08_03625 [Patescibacteria group bacterium]
MDKGDNLKGQLKIRKSFLFSLVAIIVVLTVVIFFVVVEIPKGSKDASNWKTYRNEELGFEFKYPTGEKVVERGNGVCVSGFHVSISNEDSRRMDFSNRTFVLVDNRIGRIYEMGDMVAFEGIIIGYGRVRYRIFSRCNKMSTEINRDILKTFKFLK